MPTDEPATPRCELCGEPMPIGEEMFKFHGYSGNCPKPPLAQPQQSPDSYVIAIYEGQPPLRVGCTFVVTEIEHSDNRKMLARVRAVNAHDDLLAAAKAALDWMQGKRGGPTEKMAPEQVLAQLESAITTAEQADTKEE